MNADSTTEIPDIEKHIKNMLLRGKGILRHNSMLRKDTGIQNTKGETSLALDIAIEKSIFDYIKMHKLPFQIFSEEAGKVKFHPNPTHLLVIDPLDGSTNYTLGRGIYPFGTLITCFNGLQPTLGDITGAGVIEYTNDLAWVFAHGKTVDLKGRAVMLKQDWSVSKKAPVFISPNSTRSHAVLADDLFLRNQGSFAAHLAYVLANAAAAMSSVDIGPEEIGPIVAMIKGAGGIALDLDGRDVSETPFTADRKYPLIAGSEIIVKHCLTMMKK